MATLLDLLGNTNLSVGRKFFQPKWGHDKWFEPSFRDKDGFWHGILSTGEADFFMEDCVDWREFYPPKKSKTVKLYRPIVKRSDGTYFMPNNWSSTKFDLDDNHVTKQVGWEEKEVTVEE